MTQPRDKNGKYVKSSSLGSEVFSVRLPQDQEKVLMEMVESQNTSKTALLRSILSEWLERENQRNPLSA